MECALLIFKEEIHWIGSQKCIELLGYPKKTFSFFCFFHWYESNLGEYKVKKLLSEFQFSIFYHTLMTFEHAIVPYKINNSTLLTTLRIT
jgi:hypothetical protein